MAIYNVNFDQTETVTKSYVVIIDDELTQEIYGKNVKELTNSELQDCVWSYASPQETNEESLYVSEVENVDFEESN